MIHSTSSIYGKFILLVVFALCYICACFAQTATGGTNLGDSCKIKVNVTGTCKLLQDCPRTILQKKLNKTLQYCGEEKEVNSLICCPNVGDISEQKCVEYGREVIRIAKIIKRKSGRNPTLQTIRKKRTLIVNDGENADLGEFPHMALLGYGEEERRFWVCGGSLISHKYVLTAAHCSYHKQSGSTVKWVRLGEFNQSQESSKNRADFNVKEFIKHPLYKSQIKYHDIALILLDEKITISIAHIRPACLNTATFDTKKGLIATGWGSLGEGEKLADVLQKVVLHQFSKNECQQSYNDTDSLKRLPNGVTDSLICAGDKTGGKDTCGGDSGGPLQINHQKMEYMFRIVGITAFGKKYCGQPGIPGVYTKVSDYIEWIENIVWI